MAELSPEWEAFLKTQRAQPYMAELKAKLDERRKVAQVLPQASLTFNCFLQCPYHNLKVVIVGEEPYTASGSSHGLAFSSLAPRTPGPLKAIFDDVFNDYFNGNTGGINVANSNDLSQWAYQGVLLLNRIMTVEEGKAHAHAQIGWHEFAENVIKFVNLHKHKLVFMLWGKEAQKFRELINLDRHMVLTAEYPGKEGFAGHQQFTKANNWIKKHYFNIKMPINWAILKDWRRIL